MTHQDDNLERTEEKSGEKRSRISHGIDQTSAPTCLGRIVLSALHLACCVHVKEIPVQLFLLPWGEAGDPSLVDSVLAEQGQDCSAAAVV